METVIRVAQERKKHLCRPGKSLSHFEERERSGGGVGDRKELDREAFRDRLEGLDAGGRNKQRG
jgi:hypothetical protein